MKTIITAFLSIYVLELTAQTPLSGEEMELTKFEYSLVPSLGDVQLEKTGFNFGFGKKIKKGLVGFGFGYSKYDLLFGGGQYTGILEDFENIHNLQLSVMYNKPLNNNWFLSATLSPSISSTFEGSISKEDYVVNSLVSINKNWFQDNLRSNLLLGFGFGTLFGRPSFFPILSYGKELNEKSRFTIGLPVTGYFYKFNDKNSIDFTVEPQGFFANNSSIIFNLQNQEITDSKFQFSSLNLGLGYHMKFEENWVTHLKLGYSPVNNMEIVDIDNDTLYDLNSNQTIFINMTVSFNLNKRKK